VETADHGRALIMSGQTSLGVLVLAVAYVWFGCIPRKEVDVLMSGGGGVSFEREWPARTHSNWPSNCNY
jgi:hypothetical protein